jgi:hypothetical protein
LYVFSTPELTRHLWQLKTAVFLHWCLIRAISFNSDKLIEHFQHKKGISVHKLF